MPARAASKLSAQPVRDADVDEYMSKVADLLEAFAECNSSALLGIRKQLVDIEHRLEDISERVS